MSTICVAHLVHVANDIRYFHRFLASYRRNPAGMDHDLVIIFKGFPQDRVPVPYEEELRGIAYTPYFVDLSGFDIVPYFKTGRHFSHDYFCFLNSYSVILDRDWLKKIASHAMGDNVGIAGATGSYQSISSSYIYFRVKGYPLWKKILGIPWRWYLGFFFDPFPNYHVRTNAFMMSRSVMSRIRCPRIRTKMDAYRFECGKDGLTRQILRQGLDVLIVGRDGNAYRMEDWCRSNILYQGEQENLLVADNQTNRYTAGDADVRLYLNRFAWWDTGDAPENLKKYV